MNKTAIVLLVVAMLFTISLASVMVPVTPETEEGTRAEPIGKPVTTDIIEDETWDRSYPFIAVKANITVMPGITLTILPGVIVKFKYRTSLSVEGTLNASGTYFRPIKFIPKADDPGTLDWQGVRFQNDSVDSIMNYVKVQYADGGIATWGASPSITNCSLEYNFYYGILCGENSKPIVKNNYVNFTQWAGIICGNESTPIVKKNFIKTCYYGIICYDYAEVNDNDIETCWIGIMCWGDANVTYNDVRDCMDGIHGFYSAPRIENNYIISCDGNGTRFMGSNAIIKNNTLWYNDVGMDISYDAKSILDNMEGNFVNGIDIKTCFYVDQDDIVIDGLNVDSGWSAGFTGRLTAQGTVTLYDCQNVIFENCNISNSQNAIYATNSTFTIYNTIFENSRKSQIYLDHNATGWSYNGSVNPYNVTIGGPVCLFNSYDEIEVMVQDYYEEPIAGMNIVIRESQLVLHNTTTDENGLTGSLMVKDSTVSEGGVISSPLSISVYTDEFNYIQNPMTGVYVKDIKFITFTDLGDIFPPAVLEYNVEDGERIFSVNGSITITFDEPMNQTTVEEAFSISGNVTGTFTWKGFNMTFTPDVLEYQTDYLIVISTDAMDQWGNNLPEPVSFSFTTENAPGASSSTMLIAIIAIFAIAGIGGFFMLKKLK